MSTATSSTVMKAFKVLELFRSRPLLGAAECARLLDVPRASAHRMLVSLAEAGALESTARGQYRLTLKMFELGQHVPFQRWMFDAAYLPMEGLVSRTRLASHFAVREGMSLVYIVKLRHSRDRTQAKAGQRNSLHATALGKVLLAHAPEEVIEERISHGLYRFTPYTIATAGRLREELATVREQGFAYDREERTIGLVSIASPVRDGRGDVVASLSLLGPVERYRQQLDKLAPDLTACRQEIEASLAHRRPARIPA